jgi:sulfite reductase (NADPH) flavoprotein alpha-component
MFWKSIHRWLGLSLGTAALLIAVTGTILAFFPLRDAWVAVQPKAALPVSVLAQRVADHVPGLEEIKRLPAGGLVAYSFHADQTRAARIDPADGRILGPYAPSPVERWVRDLHRSFFLGDAGRMAAAAVSLAMVLLCLSGVFMLARRLGGWRRLGAPMRGSAAQKIHGWTGRVLVLGLGVSALTALYMAAATFSLIPADSGVDPQVVSAASTGPDRRPAEIKVLQGLRAGDLRDLTLPAADDPGDTWTVVTDGGKGWIDRRSGAWLAWQPAGLARRLYDVVYALHTGEGLWFWSLLMGLMGLCVPLFWVSGLLIWLEGRRGVPRPSGGSSLRSADVLVFVASEGGTTWGFAAALHDALVRAGHRVCTTGLQAFTVAPATRCIFVLAASYGDGQAPAHAARALDRIQRLPAVGGVPVTVLGFGDRQFPAFGRFPGVLDGALRDRGWPGLLPFECIHRQSAQQFERWCDALSAALGQRIAPRYAPRVPRTVTLRLEARRDYSSVAGATAILRFSGPGGGRTAGRHRLPHFEAGDLLGVIAPGSQVPRYYSLASGRRNGFLEICVRHMPNGLCSGFLHALKGGDEIQAFIKSNEGFTLDRSHQPLILIGAGTGVAPLAGFIRNNLRKAPMYLYFGTRSSDEDFYFGDALKGWLQDRRLTRLQTAFSRPPGGYYVQDALRQDAGRLKSLLARGAALRVCGSQAMARGVAVALDEILAGLGLTVQRLREQGRYAEDVF